MSRIIDLTGQRFGRLTVIRRGPSGTQRHARWWCECDCGKACSLAFSTNLLKGHTKSCGCLAKPHGGWRTPEYKAWGSLRHRCSNPNARNYYLYGGRGIRVCDRWASFENFLADMGPRPSSGHSIDRLDVNGNYEPGNCAWRTCSQQQRNKRNSLFITHNGETLHVREWAERTGIHTDTLRCRILKLKWSTDRAFSMPQHTYQRGLCISYQGETLSVSAIAKREGVVKQTLHKYITKKGIPVEDALKILKGLAKAKPAN